MIKVPNVQVSDTTGGPISTKAGLIKIFKAKKPRHCYRRGFFVVCV